MVAGLQCHIRCRTLSCLSCEHGGRRFTAAITWSHHFKDEAAEKIYRQPGGQRPLHAAPLLWDEIPLQSPAHQIARNENHCLIGSGRWRTALVRHTMAVRKGITLLSLTMTQPTAGFGSVLPRPLRARASACFMYCLSASVMPEPVTTADFIHSLSVFFLLT